MDVVTSPRFSVLPSPGDAPRVTAPPAPDAVKTELPAKATVQQTVAPQKLAEQKSGPEPDPAGEISRDVTIDPSTQELVFRTISERSGEVVQQVPDKALLRIRAYAREQRDAEAEAESERHLSRIA